MKNIYNGELWFLGWKADHKGNRTVTFELPDDEALECFKGMTAKKGKMAGQVLMAALVDPEGESESITPEEQEKIKGGPLSKLAGQWCSDPKFNEYAAIHSIGQIQWNADSFIKRMCGVEFKRLLDHDEVAAKKFHKLRHDYSDWLNAKNKA